MPTNSFNIGRDVTLDIVDPVEGVLRFALKTSFEASPEYDELKSKALDGLPRHAYLPTGHKLTFEFDRADSRIDSYFARQEANYFAGQKLPNVSVTETISEVDGSVTQWRYTEVALRLTKGGSWKGDGIATQTVEGMASKKVQVR